MEIALAVLGAIVLWCAIAVGIAVVVGRMCVRRDGQVSASAGIPEEQTHVTGADPSAPGRRG